jgi:hypothetical protein
MIENNHAIEMMAEDVEKWLSKIEQAIKSEQLRVEALATQLTDTCAALESERTRALALEQDVQMLAAAARAALKLVSALEAKAGKTFDTGETLRAALNSSERQQA